MARYNRSAKVRARRVWLRNKGMTQDVQTLLYDRARAKTINDADERYGYRGTLPRETEEEK